MGRTVRCASILIAAVAAAFVIAACATEHVSVPKSDAQHATDQAAAELFQQPCAGCHTLSYAGTQGSGTNPRTYLAINGPNFNVRCERPVDRVLYAIENGGFSGAYMPQNIVVGKQAVEVAQFVAKFSGRKAPSQPGVTPCQHQPLGSLPAGSN